MHTKPACREALRVWKLRILLSITTDFSLHCYLYVTGPMEHKPQLRDHIDAPDICIDGGNHIYKVNKTITFSCSLLEHYIVAKVHRKGKNMQ
jgi:hypothetical protein